MLLPHNPRLPRDRRLRPRRPVILLTVGLACFGLSHLLTHAPALVERVYGAGIGPWIALALSRATGWIPFPVAEALLAGGVAAYLFLAVRACLQLVRRRRRLRNALGGAALRVAADAGIAATLFYLLWGFNYARPPLAERLGLPPGTGADTAEIAALARQEIQATNAAYLAIHGIPDAGRPTWIDESPGLLGRGLEEGWRRAVRELGLPASLSLPRGSVKRFIPAEFPSRVGISGFYFPWTGEAVVDGGEPALLLPFDMQHEKAHQRGAGPENEASFLGWVAATRSPDPYVAYAGHAMAQLTFVGILVRQDREAARALVAERLPGVRRDIRDYSDYLQRVEVRVAAEASRTVNNAYLRAKQVPGDVASYGRVARLLVAWSRAHGGHLEGSASRSAAGTDGTECSTHTTPSGALAATSPESNLLLLWRNTVHACRLASPRRNSRWMARRVRPIAGPFTSEGPARDGSPSGPGYRRTEGRSNAWRASQRSSRSSSDGERAYVRPPAGRAPRRGRASSSSCSSSRSSCSSCSGSWSSAATSTRASRSGRR